MALDSQRANRVLTMGFHEQHPTATIRCAIRNGQGRIQQHYPTLHLKPAATVKDIVWEISNLKDANLWPFHLSRSIACHHGSCQQYRIIYHCDELGTASDFLSS